MTTPPRTLIAVLSASNFLIGVGVFQIIGMVEPVSGDLAVSPTQVASLMTVYALSYAVLSPILVSITGTMGRRRVMAIGLGIFASAALLSALAPNMAWLNAGRVVAAMGAGIFTPVATATAGALYPPEQRARVLSAVFFGTAVAQVLGVPAGSWIAYTFGWRWSFWLVVALAVPCITLIWTRVPAGLHFQPVSLRDLSKVLRDLRMLFAILFTSSFLGAIYILFTFIAPLLSTQMGYGRDGVTSVLLVAGAGAILGNITGGLLADRFGWRIAISFSCVMQIVMLPFFSFLPIPDAALMALMFAWSAAGWTFIAGQQMRLINLAGAQAPVVLALNAAGVYIGAALGSGLGALAIKLFGIGSLGIAAGLLAVFALIHITLSAALPPQARPS